MPPPILSMDEYVEFVEFNLKHIVPPEAFWLQKEQTPVKVPFKLN